MSNELTAFIYLQKRLLCDILNNVGAVGLIFNRNYSDSGQEYSRRQIKTAFENRGIKVFEPEILVKSGYEKFEFKVCLFLDKDIALAKYLENNGVLVINSSRTIEVCDNKQKTILEVGSDIKTIFSPFCFEGQALKKTDKFLEQVKNFLPFPIVVKPNVGSLGAGVVLIKNEDELKYFPNNSYSEFIEGQDRRVYILNCRAIAAVTRKSSGFVVNQVGNEGSIKEAPLDSVLVSRAEKIAKKLNLQYGSVDFILGKNGRLYFLEANSNAYFKAAEIGAGVKIAEPLVDFLCGF